jgi:DNA-binding LytR/AlgR family response regulator
MNIVVFEDEAPARRRLKRILDKMHLEYEVLVWLGSIREASAWFGQNEDEIDLIIADIELADGLSFEVLKGIEDCPPVIFTTAYDHYALKAFQSHGVAYLLKPVKFEEFEEAKSKLKIFNSKQGAIDFERLSQLITQPHVVAKKRFLIRVGSKLEALETKDCAYFFVDQKLVFVRTIDDKRYPMDQSLDELEANLSANEFFRINRQFIVRYESIGAMHVVSKSRIKLELIPQTDMDAIVSAEKSPRFREWLKDPMS